MKTILFQGDSITDCQRDYSVEQSLGQGYALIVGSQIGFEQPNEYRVLNRGVSGNRIVDLYARIKCDCWNLAPDYLSILIGVNDVWHEFGSGNGVDAERYQNIYRMYLSETKERLPECNIMLLEPFCLPGSGTNECGYEAFRYEVELRQKVVLLMAEEFELPRIPLQKDFDEMAKRVSPEYWLVDGVHPTPAGHKLIAAKWLEMFRSISK